MSKNIKRQTKQTTTDNERLLAAENQIELLREQIEFWREQVESLNFELLHKEQELQATEQELNYTNKELCSAFMLERINLTEAKEFCKIILKSNKSASEYLASVLSAIYGCQVQPEELEQIDNTSMPLKNVEATVIINNSKQLRAKSKVNANNEIIENSRQARAKSKELKAQFNELGFKFVMLQASSKIFIQDLAEFIAELIKKNNVNKACENTIETLPPPPKKTLELAFPLGLKQFSELRFEKQYKNIFKKKVKDSNNNYNKQKSN